eukprot:gene17478-20812_t
MVVAKDMVSRSPMMKKSSASDECTSPTQLQDDAFNNHQLYSATESKAIADMLSLCASDIATYTAYHAASEKKGGGTISPHDVPTTVTIMAFGDSGKVRLLRFLRACNGDASEAATMYSKHLRWRLEYDVDSVLARVIGKSPSEFLKLQEADAAIKYCPAACFVGWDPDSNVIQMERLGFWHPEQCRKLKSTPSSTSRFNLLDEYSVTLMEWMCWLLDVRSCQEGKLAQIVKLSDERGVTLSQLLHPAGINLFKSFVSLSHQNYPETLRCHFCINRPQMVRPLLWAAQFAVENIIYRGNKENASKKIVVLGDTDDKCVREELAKIIPRAFLPVEFGGLSTSVPFLWPPPDIPENKNRQISSTLRTHEVLTDLAGQVTINPGGKRMVAIPLTANHSQQDALIGSMPAKVTWHFTLEHKNKRKYAFMGDVDITAAVVFVAATKTPDDDDDGEAPSPSMTMFAPATVSAQEDGGRVEGTFDLLQDGTLIIEWDNARSWFHKKTVSYQIK